MLFLVAALPVVLGLKIRARQDDLKRRGALIEALVVGHDDRSTTSHLWVRYLSCGCPVAVATSNLAAHPVGSLIVVRYDPQHPTRAQALTDVPNPYEPVLLTGGGLALGIVICVPLVLLGLRRTRRARALVETTIPTARVRVDVWERPYLNQILPYVSVYPVDMATGGPPLVAFPIASEMVAEIQPGDGFDLFWSGRAGDPLALRRDELVIVPAGKPQDAEWERTHRKPEGDVLRTSSRGQIDEDDGLRIFQDADEARVYRRRSRQVRWLFALLLPATMLRALPLRFIGIVVAVLLGLMALLFTALWRQARLLDRLAGRLGGTLPAGRKSRLLARRAVQRRIAAPAGAAELAELLGVAPAELAAADRRSAYAFYASGAVTALLFVVLLGRLVVA